MGALLLSPQEATDVVWFCRRLAAALQGGSPLLAALEAIGREAPPSLCDRLALARARVASGDPLAHALREWGLPSFVWRPVTAGEYSHTLVNSLVRVADRLEAEAAAAPVPDTRLYEFSLTFGRLGMLFACGVAIFTAMESAAESVFPSEASDALTAARGALDRGNVRLSAALKRLLPDLPPQTIDMIRDGEIEGRLDFALSVVSDYLLDQAAEPTPQEVSHG